MPLPDMLDRQEEEETIRRVLLRVRVHGLGITIGLLFGLGLFAATIILVVRGGEQVGSHLRLLAAYFPGFSVTGTGSLVGFAYAFVLGYVIGCTVALIYNALVKHT